MYLVRKCESVIQFFRLKANSWVQTDECCGI